MHVCANWGGNMHTYIQVCIYVYISVCIYTYVRTLRKWNLIRVGNDTRPNPFCMRTFQSDDVMM